MGHGQANKFHANMEQYSDIGEGGSKGKSEPYTVP